MSFLCDNIAVISVAALASTLVWVFGGTCGNLLPLFVPWLLLVLVEVLFRFPQHHKTETTYEARARVWYELKHDPVVWVALGFLGLLTIPFVNNGLCEFCDAVKIATGVDPRPPVSVLPFCVNRLDHLSVFLWFASALIVIRNS